MLQQQELGKYLAEVAISGDLPIGPVIDKFANIDDAMALQGKYNAVLAADGIQSRVDALFVKLDLDGSGGLDKSELEALISRCMVYSDFFAHSFAFKTHTTLASHAHTRINTHVTGQVGSRDPSHSPIISPQKNLFTIVQFRPCHSRQTTHAPVQKQTSSSIVNYAPASI